MWRLKPGWHPKRETEVSVFDSHHEAPPDQICESLMNCSGFHCADCRTRRHLKITQFRDVLGRRIKDALESIQLDNRLHPDWPPVQESHLPNCLVDDRQVALVLSPATLQPHSRWMIRPVVANGHLRIDIQKRRQCGVILVQSKGRGSDKVIAKSAQKYREPPDCRNMGYTYQR